MNPHAAASGSGRAGVSSGSESELFIARIFKIFLGINCAKLKVEMGVGDSASYVLLGLRGWGEFLTLGRQ